MDALYSLKTSNTKEVSNTSCSKLCDDKLKNCRVHIDILIREVEDLKYERYSIRKEQKPLKEKLEAQTKDFKKLQEDYSIKCCHYDYAKAEIAVLTAELDTLKAKFENADFNFKKFDVSSEIVETMIEKQLKWQDQKAKKLGLGYDSVPPPFNHNYTPNPVTNEEMEREDHLQYGKPAVAETIEPEYTRPINFVNVNDTDASTSFADKVVVEDGNEENKSDSSFVENSSEANSLLSAVSDNSVNNDVKTVDSVSSKTCGDVLNSKNPNVKKFKPQKFVKEGESFLGPRPSPNQCPCTCGKSSGLGPSPNPLYLKKQICFNCGIAGHIARNCPHRPYVPYYAQGWENVSRGRYSKRNPSKSRSDGDWNAHKDKRAKTPIHKAKKTEIQVDRPKDLERDNVILQLISQLLSNKRVKSAKKHLPRDGSTNSNSVKSKSSQGSSTNSHLTNKPKAKGGQNSKSRVETSIRSNDKILKPNYRWVLKSVIPKGQVSKTTNSPVISLCSLSDKQDMSWESVTSVDSNGKPSVKMDWVPKTN